MRKSRLVLAAAAGSAALTFGTLHAQGGPPQLPGQVDVARVQAGTSQVDPNHTLIGWRANHFGCNEYFGINFAVPMVSDEVELDISAAFEKK